MPSLALACRLSAVSMALRRAFPGAFDPASLFANGEQGLWYDMSDFDRYMSELGPDSVVNGGFDDGLTGWTAKADVIVEGGRAKCFATSAVYNAILRQTQPFSGAGWYRIRGNVQNVSMQVFCQLQARYVSNEAYIAWSHPNAHPIGAVSTADFSFYADAPFYVNFLIDVNVNDPSRIAYVDNIRCEKLTAINTATLFQDAAGTIPVTAVEQPVGLILDKSGRGNHASQPTTTARAVLRARYNLYLNSETLSTQNVAVSAGQHRLRFEGAGTITLSGAATGTLSAGTHTVTCTAGTLTSTVSGVVTRADLRDPSTPSGLPSYQRIAAATDYDTVGFPVYIDPDGIDDSYQTNRIDFTATDKMTIWAGLRKVDDNERMLCELSFSWAANNGGFSLQSGPSTVSYFSGSSANATAATNQGGRFNSGLYPAPDFAVITAQHDIAGDLSTIRRNGSSSGAIDGTADKGTGNFGNYPLYLFSRGGTYLRWKGHFYGLIIRGAATDTAQLEQTEQWLNTRMGGIY